LQLAVLESSPITVIFLQPSWLHKIVKTPLFDAVLKHMKVSHLAKLPGGRNYCFRIALVNQIANLPPPPLKDTPSPQKKIIRDYSDYSSISTEWSDASGIFSGANSHSLA